MFEDTSNENVKGFYPESFDRILLDPPCSALGLRPKLRVEVTLKQLQRFSKYQKRLVRNAVSLLKVGGILTYSTCTIHGEENEGICYYILHTYPFMRLLPIDKDYLKDKKQWGLPGFGLSDEERRFVKRYDPSLEDTVGFFIAKFIKLSTDIKHVSHEKTNSLLNEFIVT
jgi:16S rRNA C967 or C1407 C5-methylase (RsmB/RsmF family)